MAIGANNWRDSGLVVMDHGGNAVSLFSSYFLSERYSGPNLTRRDLVLNIPKNATGNIISVCLCPILF